MEKKTTWTSYRDPQKRKPPVYISLHTYSMSHHSVLPHVVHLQCRLCVHAHVAHNQEAPEASGLVFDSMLSEWLISQCFDLLQLLELCLVRAWIWHTFTEYNVAALYLLFFFFQFSFWKDIMFQVLKFWYRTWLFYTHTWIDFTIRRSLNEKQKCNVLYYCNFCMGIIELLLLLLDFPSALSLLCDSSKHSGSSIDALKLFLKHESCWCTKTM